MLLLLGSIWLGGQIAADPVWAKAFTFTGIQITWMLIGYGFVAAVLPVWLILAPRDYLSTFLKIGTIIALAIGILVTMPDLKMPALTQFIDGTGPVWKGGLFPFLFITIACGAVSGFHALISSGTTPKLLANESHARYIGYGGMLMESFVAIMAMVAASVIEPGVYFAMNSPAAVVGSDVVTVAQTVSSWGFAITPEALSAVAHDIGETTILARAGGAPTLAVGIAQILHSVLPGENTMAFWYHFAILFEALFILTAVDAGTRAGRFMLQDLLGSFVPALKRTESWTANLIATAGCVAMWGYLLYQGVIDPLGGINTLWPLFGISNQMLAGIALMLATVVLIKMKRQRYIWVTMLPAVWLLICTTTAGFIKLFDANPAVGFLSLAKKYSTALDAGQVIAPAKNIDFERVEQDAEHHEQEQDGQARVGVRVDDDVLHLVDVFRRGNHLAGIQCGAVFFRQGQETDRRVGVEQLDETGVGGANQQPDRWQHGDPDVALTLHFDQQIGRAHV